MSHRRWSLLGLVLALPASALLAQGPRNFQALLDSYQETPATLSTTGRGLFRAQLNRDASALEFELSYRGLEGTTTTAAHIHLGRPGVSGGVIIWLCGAGSAENPTCPTAGTVKGTLVANGVVGPSGQGIAAGEWDEFLRALRAGAGYVNVHTNLYPGGEIRGQVAGHLINPGQGGGAPGRSGDAPGQGGDSPGQSGGAPGQGSR